MTAADIDRVRAAPIETLLEARGFRRSRNRWACHTHDDKRPSCSVRNNRLHCWVCNRWWSAIDLVMELDAIDLKGAVRKLAAFYGIWIPERSLTAAERREYARASARADALSQSLADFSRGYELLSERKLKASDNLLAAEIEPTELLAKWHQQAHVFRQASPCAIAKSWSTMAAAEREELERIGREDREHSEKVTWAIVDLLARAQDKEAL